MKKSLFVLLLLSCLYYTNIYAQDKTYPVIYSEYTESFNDDWYICDEMWDVDAVRINDIDQSITLEFRDVNKEARFTWISEVQASQYEFYDVLTLKALNTKSDKTAEIKYFESILNNESFMVIDMSGEAWRVRFTQ